MAQEKTKPKYNLDDYLSFSAPKRKEYVSYDEPINVEGELKKKEEPKKGVKQAQVEKKPAPVAAPPVAPAPIPKPVPKVSPREALAPEVPASAPAPVASPVPPSKTQPSIPTPHAQGPSAWERALIGATPLLVGFLSGNKLEGTQASSNYLVNSESGLYKDEQDFNKKLAEMQAKKALKDPALAKNPTSKTFQYMGSDKQARIGRVVNGEFQQNEATDPLAVPKAAAKDTWIPKTIQTKDGPREVVYNPITEETREIGEHFVAPRTALADMDFQGEKTKTLVDMNSGGKTFLGKAWEKPGSAIDREKGKDDRQEKQIRVGLLKEITKPTSVYSQKIDSMDGMQRAAELLNNGGPIGHSGLRMILARSVFGEKGPLSDGDVSRLSGDPGARASVSRIWDKYINGAPLTETDRKDVRKVIDVAYELAKQDANRYLDGFINTYKAEGHDLGPQLQHFRNLPQLPVHKGGGRRGVEGTQIQGPPPVLSFEEWKAQKGKKP